MKREKHIAVIAVLVCLIVLSGIALHAEEVKSTSGAVSPTKDSQPANAWDKWWSNFNNPTPYLKMGLDFRFRTIYAKNIDTLEDDAKSGKHSRSIWNFQRYRARWSTKWLLNTDVDFNTRLTWEFRTWEDPERKKPGYEDLEEALFDTMNITARNLFGAPLTAVIGRQDLIFGNGWLVLDGTPLDGSRTIFVDAARFTYDWKEKETKIDLVYIDHAAAADRWLKPINDSQKGLTEQDEYGAILYLTNKSMEKTQLEGYFMYKNDNPVDYTADFPASLSRKAEIFTFGGAIQSKIDDHWNYRVEGATQGGTKDDSSGITHDLRTYGANTILNYDKKDEQDTNYHIGYEYCSGDDPGTDDIEQFDPLWAEWPRWSELYIYAYSRETAIGESTNVHRFNIGHKFNPCEKWQICTDYHYLLADDNSITAGPANDFVISPHSKFRGQLFTCWAKYKVNKQLSGHLLGEYLIPGSYYDQSNRDHAYFLRFNVEYRF